MADVKNIKFLDDSNWESVVNTDKVALLFFMIGHDLNCKRQIPHIIRFAEQYGERFTVGVVDGLKSPNALKVCNVKKMPQTIIVRNGISLGGFEGVFTMNEESLDELLTHLEQFEQVGRG